MNELVCEQVSEGVSVHIYINALCTLTFFDVKKI